MERSKLRILGFERQILGTNSEVKPKGQFRHDVNAKRISGITYTTVTQCHAINSRVNAYGRLVTRDAMRAARVKKRVGYLCRRFIFLRRSQKW